MIGTLQSHFGSNSDIERFDSELHARGTRDTVAVAAHQAPEEAATVNLHGGGDKNIPHPERT